MGQQPEGNSQLASPSVKTTKFQNFRVRDRIQVVAPFYC